MPYQGGLFSPPVSIGVGDPYVDPSKSTALTAHGSSKGQRQFGIGKGIPGTFNRLFEGEQFVDTAKVLSRQRLKGRQEFLTPNGFRHTSRPKKSACQGDYSGTFTKPFPHICDGTAPPRGDREAIRDVGPRNILTQPPKRAVGSQGATPKILFTDTEYVPSPYDLYDQKERELNKTRRDMTQGRPAFKVSVEQSLSKPLEESELFASKSVMQIPASPISRPATSHAKSTGNLPEGEMIRAFRPSSPPKVGGPLYGTFSEYPEHVADPYNEKLIRKAAMSSRLLPTMEQYKDLDEKIRDRRAWTPTSPAKSMYTKSTLFSSIGSTGSNE